MKLNAQTTALGLLSNSPGNRILLPEESTEMPAALDFIENEFKDMLPLFKRRVQYISKPFFNAYLKTEQKILEILLHEPVKQSGTLILPNSSEATLTTFYDLETKRIETEVVTNGRLAMFAKFKQDQRYYLVLYSHIVDGYATTFQTMKDLAQGYTNEATVNMVLGLILFTKYCEVETKLIPAGKETTHRLQRYVNHTTQPIEILDATWFTTLVRSGAFTVGEDTGGFFRWQAVGTERSERKLIWVSPYKKQGYTRKAKVLAHRPDPPS